ncbi:Hypothetical predicted protein, partial [Paramuricea clavata]
MVDHLTAVVEETERQATSVQLNGHDEYGHGEKFRVDRRKLEQMLRENGDDSGLTADEFFNQIMHETSTVISWPTKLKIGAKSKKEIRVCFCLLPKCNTLYYVDLKHNMFIPHGNAFYVDFKSMVTENYVGVGMPLRKCLIITLCASFYCVGIQKQCVFDLEFHSQIFAYFYFAAVYFLRRCFDIKDIAFVKANFLTPRGRERTSSIYGSHEFD